jgi:hypothetical protein
MNKIENSTKKLELINQWISNCDTKSSFILTFYGVVLTIIFTSNIGSDLINTISFTRAEEVDFESIENFILFLTTMAFFITSIVTFYQIYLTLKGRIDIQIYSQNGLQADSNIFFGSIASKTFQAFENESNIDDESIYLNDLNSQIFINSNIVSEKFKNYNKSLYWMFISLGFFILSIIEIKCL